MAEDNADPEVPPAVLIVAGPTASGKSGLALALAETFGGTIINADSMQVYADLEILTARPEAADLARAPHRLYGVLPGTERCSAGRWRDMAVREIEAARRAGRLPIVAGGTGLYLRALMQGIAPVPDVPAAVRQEATERLAALGGAAFLAELAERDPESAARLHPQDRQRLIRAWEVVTATGRPLSDWQLAQPGGSPPYRFHGVILTPPRDLLYAHCDERFLRMLDRGALEEVRGLLSKGLDPSLPVMKTLGLRELGRHLSGELSLEDAVAQAQVVTRRYAKRQMTWLRNQLIGNFLSENGINQQFSESILPEIFNKIRQFLLTA